MPPTLNAQLVVPGLVGILAGPLLESLVSLLDFGGSLLGFCAFLLDFGVSLLVPLLDFGVSLLVPLLVNGGAKKRPNNYALH